MNKQFLGALAVTTALSPVAAMAQTEVQFWHAFTGRLGELVKAQVEEFNASQDEFVVVESHKGNYSETLNAGIAAFRAGEQPHILMVFEVECKMLALVCVINAGAGTGAAMHNKGIGHDTGLRFPGEPGRRP